MNLNTTKFFNSTQVNISSKMNEYLKKNFGYEVEGDIATLREAKKSLELEQVELKDTGYMNQKYMENMLMIETISSLLKAHGEKVVSEELDLDDFSKKSPESISKQKKSIQPTLGDNPLGEDNEEEKGPDHYRWKNDSQLAVVIGRLEGAMDELDNAIQYRGENSAKFFNNGDKAGVGNLMGIKQKLEDIHSDWNKSTEYYGM